MAPTDRSIASIPLDTDSKLTVWNMALPVISWVSHLTVIIMLGYGLSDLIIRSRQKIANEKATESEREAIKEKIRLKAWAQLARIDPQGFLEKVIMKKEKGTSERRAALKVLYQVSPECARENVAALKDKDHTAPSET
jgi:hypothetical protein